MRWAARMRNAFIRDRLAVVGTLNRSALVDRFGISHPQASADIKRFITEFPDAMRYDLRRRCWVSTSPPSVHARDTSGAADTLMRATDDWLVEVAKRDPSMIRDVAAALIFERTA